MTARGMFFPGEVSIEQRNGQDACWPEYTLWVRCRTRGDVRFVRRVLRSSAGMPLGTRLLFYSAGVKQNRLFHAPWRRDRPEPETLAVAARELRAWSPPGWRRVREILGRARELRRQGAHGHARNVWRAACRALREEHGKALIPF